MAQMRRAKYLKTMFYGMHINPCDQL